MAMAAPPKTYTSATRPRLASRSPSRLNASAIASRSSSGSPVLTRPPVPAQRHPRATAERSRRVHHSVRPGGTSVERKPQPAQRPRPRPDRRRPPVPRGQMLGQRRQEHIPVLITRTSRLIRRPPGRPGYHRLPAVLLQELSDRRHRRESSAPASKAPSAATVSGRYAPPARSSTSTTLVHPQARQLRSLRLLPAAEVPLHSKDGSRNPQLPYSNAQVGGFSWGRWDSNPHWQEPKSCASAVGLRPRGERRRLTRSRQTGSARSGRAPCAASRRGPVALTP